MDEIYRNGDKVFYKRPNEDGWRGPGRVIGQDGVVFVQHGSQLVRVHVCRTKKVQDEMIRGNGNESFIRLLLRYNANVNTKDDEGNTPLLKAMKFKNIGYVKILVEHPETDIFVQNYKSQNVFDLEKEGSDQVYR